MHHGDPAREARPDALGRIGRIRWWLLLLLASVAFSAVAWMQTRATLVFDVRAQQPVPLQIFYSASGAFSEADSLHVVAMPSQGGRVRVRIPAARAAYLRIDPSAAARPFDVCGLGTGGTGEAGFRAVSSNQLAWRTQATCTRLASEPGSNDPFLVLQSERPASGLRAARGWRLAARISLVASLLLLVVVAFRLDRAGTLLSSRADRVFRAISARAHWLVLLLMVMMGSLIAHALPPNGIPDEVAHMSKAAKVNAGVLFDDSGTVPVVDVLDMYANMNDVREPAVIDPTLLGTALGKPLACGRAVRTLPPMADNYAPHLYVVSAATLSAACALDTSFGTFLRLSRILNLILAAALVAVGIRYATFGKWSLAAVALLPMTLAQAASVSADSLTLGMSFCFLGLVSGVAGGQLAPARVRYWLPVLALALAFAKPGSAWILVAILFCRRAYPADGRAFAATVVAVMVVPWLVHAAWVVLSSSGAQPLAGVDPEGNVALLLHDPMQVAGLGFNTFFGPHGEFIWKSTIGLLGWLDVPLSNWAYALGALALVGSLWTNDRTPPIGWPARGVVLAAAAGAVAMLSLPLYLYWTHPESGIVMGLQGRYFLPPLAFLLVWSALRARPVARLVLLAAILSLPLLSLDAVRQINDRYYLVGH